MEESHENKLLSTEMMTRGKSQ